MKKFFGLVGMAVLGGALTLGGYKLLFNETVVVNNKTAGTTSIVQTNYTPTFNKKSTAVAAAAIDFTLAAEQTVHSVVHVKNTTIRTQTNPLDIFFGNGNGQRKFEQVGTGSGVIISSDGYIVTNNHVIDNANDIQITLNNQKKFKAELIGTDANNDIALLKIDADMELPFTPFANSDNIKIGEWVLAVGNPYNLTSTVTAGIVSAKGRDLEGNRNIESFIQTDAAVNPGNSGGALVNTRGELVGINTAISSKTGSFIGYSFAVPSNIAKKIVDDLLEFGVVQEAILGIAIDTDYTEEGVKVGKVFYEEGKKMELKEGDIIKSINNVKISKFSELKGQLTSKRPGDNINVTIDRDGDLLTKNIVLTKKVKQIIAKTFGWQLKDLTPKEKKKRNVIKGVKIEYTADKRNDLSGYIITKINGEEVDNAEKAAQLIDNLSNSNYRNNLIELISLTGDKERFRF
ncbi:trypsin-like peptidase domain-containing protein [Polaribacter sp. R77954]|uniref:trypsin-like peptidase domain-containing protein n=1 Tax=Polaribacter sp. R77954 TaxID=3093870 RepID=UPI0037C92870